MICTQRPYVPGLYDYPSSLTHSSETQVWTLWPLKLSEGPNERGQSGFRRYTEISKLKWSPKPVLQKTEELEPEEQDRAKAACTSLMGYNASPYRRFHEEHLEVLEKGTATEWLSHKVLARQHIECVLWPHLYPTTASCDTAHASCAQGKEFERQASVPGQGVLSSDGVRGTIRLASAPFRQARCDQIHGCSSQIHHTMFLNQIGDD